MTDIAIRDTELRRMLSERRHDVLNDVQSRLRDGRTDREKNGRDDIECSDTDVQGDIDIALLQMRAETLTRIDEAIARLDSGHYGCCRECGIEITERRLRALPFAVRCQSCEQRREQGQARQLAQRRSTLSVFSDLVNP